MDTIRLSIVTPNGEIFNDDVKTVTLPGKEGEFGVLPGHSSLVSSLTVGVIIIEKANSTEGKYDNVPEMAFYMVGGIDEVLAKAEKMK